MRRAIDREELVEYLKSERDKHHENHGNAETKSEERYFHGRYHGCTDILAWIGARDDE